MATKRPSAAPPSASKRGRLEILLEEIRSQNEATIDAVHALGRELRQEFRDEIGRLEQRLATVEAVVRQNSIDIQKNSADIQKNSADIRALREAVERLEQRAEGFADHARLEALERRVAALEAARA